MSFIKKNNILAVILFLFFLAYAVLSVVRHVYYGSFGADLGFIDRLIWLLSRFQITETAGVFVGHFEPIYFLFVPFYWIWPNPILLLLLQAFIIVSAGIPVFLLAKEKKLHISICYALVVSFLLFYGVQNALWFDFHTSPFGAAFFLWFLYFLEKKNGKFSFIFFVLTVISKENFAPYVFLLTGVYYVLSRNRLALYYCLGAFFYSFVLFFMYFPTVRDAGYSYASSQGLVSGNPMQLLDTENKQKTVFYTFAWVGFLPFLSPLYLLPILGNFASYFIIGREYEAAHDIFMHYRADLAPLLFFATIMSLARYKFLNKPYTAFYLIVCILVLQYTLHLPLSYLSKRWFWTKPSGVVSIENIIKEIPDDAGIVSQNNLYPHISQRKNIELLWPDRRTFTASASPCEAVDCPWFRWKKADYEYLLVDISHEWDIRHLLQNRDEFIQAVDGMEKLGIIKRVKEDGTTRLYTIEKDPK